MRCTVAFLYPILAPFVLTFQFDFWNTLGQTDSSIETASQQHEKHTTRQATTDTDKTTWIDIDETLFSNAWQPEPRAAISEPTARSSIVKFGANVACWPSSGGFWLKKAGLVDMNFLDLWRFTDTPRQFNQTAEDEFCIKLRMLGADWWPNSNILEPTIKRQYLIAWPEDEKVACYIPITQAEKMGEPASIKYHNAMDMEERCYEIIAMGGKRCRCKSECPDLRSLDWGFKDPGPDGCDDPGYDVDDSADLDGFYPEKNRGEN